MLRTPSETLYISEPHYLVPRDRSVERNLPLPLRERQQKLQIFGKPTELQTSCVGSMRCLPHPSCAEIQAVHFCALIAAFGGPHNVSREEEPAPRAGLYSEDGWESPPAGDGAAAEGLE